MIDWNCPNCNYKNFGHRAQCRECEYFYAHKSLEFGDWYCKCGVFNFKMRKKCYKCKKGIIPPRDSIK